MKCTKTMSMLTGVLNVLKLLLQKFEKEWVFEQLSE